MNKIKKHFKGFNIILLMLSVFVSVFCLTGCSDKNEIEDIGLVVALGVDLNENNEVVASVQILKSGKKSEGANETSKTEVYVGSGDTISDALYKLSKKASKLIKFSNEKCIIVGEKFAREGIEPVIDLSLRFADMRSTDPILVTKGEASDLIKFKSDEIPISAFEIDALIRRQENLCYTSKATNRDFINNMRGESGISTCGVIGIGKSEDDEKNTLILSGSAVFKKDKLIGYMDAKETRGMQWIKGKVKAGGIVARNANGSKIGFHILRSASKYTPSIIDKTAKIKVDIKNQTIIDEIYEATTENMDFNRDPRIITALSKNVNFAIEEEINSAIDVAQRVLHADIFDFGGILYREKPNEWKVIRDKWNEIFPKISIEVNVSSQIRQTGGMSKSINN
ncbi:germination protein GerKC [Clostridium zeae]|uniref:Germination protein GerKC n=1 Tax=Clostridium zeae TaxID=2759022 RepID=A0ABQ1ECW5_9CLOT|nr:Ger(x)C family spore germination protein [Clostridium zeae]GFZ32591.1 germination protein GerKC [Clostridium zeae]